jgi:hypothetical protein
VQKMFCNQTLTDCSFENAVSGLRRFRYTSLNACTSEVTERASAPSRSKLMHEPRNEPFWNGSLCRANRSLNLVPALRWSCGHRSVR